MSQWQYYTFNAFLILCQTFAVPATQTCPEEQRSVYGMMLQGHTFLKIKATNWPQCIMACNDDIRCQSINYAIDEDTCEFNKRTKEAKPEDFLPASHRAYMTRLGERVPVGSIPELPAESCAEIKEIEGENAVSGSYWLESNSSGSAIQAYCGEECTNYQNLTDGSRRETVAGDPHPACDSMLGPAWFRFLGDAGTKMPTTCVPAYKCGTHAPGWLNGVHPTVSDGQVTRQVCFSWDNNCCSWDTFIQVRNCGDFLVYYLSGTSEHPCSLRYCGTD